MQAGALQKWVALDEGSPFGLPSPSHCSLPRYHAGMSQTHSNIYVRGWSVGPDGAGFSEADLLALFAPHGEITSIRLVQGTEGGPNQAAPHAFVRYSAPEEVSGPLGGAQGWGRGWGGGCSACKRPCAACAARPGALGAAPRWRPPALRPVRTSAGPPPQGLPQRSWWAPEGWAGG